MDTAWDILNKVLAGAGIRSNKFFDEVLSNGCELVEPALVQERATRLSGWTHEKVLEGLRPLVEKDDADHLGYFQDEEQDL
ncbi:MAG: hypothetical protein WAW42_08155 [Candidatus Competibacteraceae bacterium]